MNKPAKKMPSSLTGKEKRLLPLFVFAAVMVLATYLFLTYEPKSITQKFYESRLGVDVSQEYIGVEIYQDYDMAKAKKLAERNIYLQD